MNTQPSDQTQTSLVFEHYLHCLGLDSQACEAYLARLHDSEPRSAAEVRNLVEAANWVESKGLLGEDPPDVIGPYQIVDRLGEGGMGVVYKARRQEDIHMTVAIKILKRNFADRRLLARFYREREILASLEHPHIARIYDAGLTNDGIPYAVMECVDGLILTKYCEQHLLNLQQRLLLFLNVCHAMAYAHRNLILHCDLKPANILVNREGAPKLLDFGIARYVLDHREGDATATLGNSSFLTLQYASPEQIAQKPLNTMTDIYSLGVILYELLTGLLPFAGTSMNPISLHQRMESGPPMRPSQIIKESQNRNRAGKSLLKIDRELDHIILKALEFQTESRYATVEEMAQDIDAYLHNRPVKARNGGFFYQVGKFTRRHKTQVTLFAAFILTLTFSLIQTQRQLQATAEQRDQKEAISQYIIRLFENANPNRHDRQLKTALELVETGSQDLKDQLQDQPRTKVELYAILGDVFSHMGQFSQAIDNLKLGLEIAQREYGDDHAVTAGMKVNLSHTLVQVSRDAEAKELLPNVQQVLERDKKEHYIALGIFYAVSADLAAKDLDYQTAAQYQRQELALYQKYDSADVKAISFAKANLASSLRMLGQHEEAENLFKESLKTLDQSLGPEHNKVLMVRVNYASMLRSNHQHARAEKLLREAIERGQQSLGQNHHWVLYMRSQLALTIADQGKLDAFVIYGEALLTDYLDELGLEHQDTQIFMGNLSFYLAETGQFLRAEQLDRQALAARIKVLGESHPRLAYNYISIAGTMLQQNRWREAKLFAAKTTDILAERRDWNSLKWIALQQLGHASNLAGDYEEADRYFSRIKKEKTEQSDSPDLTEAILGLAETARLQGNRQIALELLDELTSEFSDPQQRDSDLGRQYLTITGRLWLDRGEWAKAQASFEELYQLYQRHPNLSGQFMIPLFLARIALEHNDFPAVKKYHRQALEISRACYGENAPAQQQIAVEIQFMSLQTKGRHPSFVSEEIKQISRLIEFSKLPVTHRTQWQFFLAANGSQQLNDSTCHELLSAFPNQTYSHQKAAKVAACETRQ